MDFLRALAVRFRSSFLSSDAERELEEEIRFHLEMQTQEHLRSGLTPSQARRRAAVEFGGVAGHKEAVRDLSPLRAIDEVVTDLRYAFRGLARTPAFTVVAVLTLAFGIGANAGLFGLFNALFLRPPAGIVEPDRTVRILRSGASSAVSVPTYLEVREWSRSMDEIAASFTTDVDLQAGSSPSRVPAAFISDNYFEVVGAPFTLGRSFADEEAGILSAHPVAILSHDAWQRLFRSDPSVVGREIRITGIPFVVVGVGPVGFVGTEFEEPADVWAPLGMLPAVLPGWEDAIEDPNRNLVRMVGRLRPDVIPAQAQAELAPIGHEIDARAPARDEWWYEPIDLQVEFLRGWYSLGQAGRAELSVFAFAWIITALVLLVACANLINLLLVRAVARRREIAIRFSLGMSRGRLFRLFVAEALLLAVVAGIVGSAACLWAANSLQAFIVSNASRRLGDLDVSPDLGTMVFILLLIALISTMLGILPVRQAAKAEVAPILKGDDSRGVRRARLQSVLVVAQVTTSFVLLLSGGLFVQKLIEMRRADPGFESNGIVMLSVDLNGRGYSEAEAAAFYEELRRGLERHAIIESIVGPTAVPMAGNPIRMNYVPSDRPEPGEAEGLARPIGTAWGAGVGAGFFRILGIPVLRGRELSESDHRTRAPVAVVSETLARRFWPGEDAVGKLLVQRTQRDTLIEVVGVVADVNWVEIGSEPEPIVYLPSSRFRIFADYILLRTEAELAEVTPIIQAEASRLDPSVALFDLRPLTEVVEEQVGLQRAFTVVLASLGGLALLLAAFGIYGVMAFTVAGRAREIGIRMAVGATGWRVVQIVLHDGIRLSVIGLLVGLVAAVPLTSVARAGISNLDPLGPVLVLGIGGLFTGVAVLAAWIPAVRASRLNPAAAVRLD